MAESASELIAFCDADDLWLPTQAAALVALYDRVGGIVTANSWWLFDGGIHPSRKRYKGRFPAPDEQRLAILQQNFVSTMSLFPRTMLDEIGPFDEVLRPGEDLDFWLRAIFAGYRVSVQREPLSLYRWGSSGVSSHWREMDSAVETVLRRALARPDLRPQEAAYLRRRLAGRGPAQLGREGDAALRSGRYREAARCYRQAAALCPSERSLVWKARVLALPPLTGPFVRARQLRIERQLGFAAPHIR